MEVFQEKIRKLEEENVKLEAAVAQEEQQFAKLQFAQHTNEAILSELRKNLEHYNARVAQSLLLDLTLDCCQSICFFGSTGCWRM
jgi:chromosome segregation ATPase